MTKTYIDTKEVTKLGTSSDYTHPFILGHCYAAVNACTDCVQYEEEPKSVRSSCSSEYGLRLSVIYTNRNTVTVKHLIGLDISIFVISR